MKLNSLGDVRNLLARSGSLHYPLRLKPDLSPEDRKTEALLMKERWSLIQQGVERGSIKLRRNQLFVNNHLYGSVQSGKLELTSDTAQVNQSSSPVILTFHLQFLTRLCLRLLMSPNRKIYTASNGSHSLSASLDSSPPDEILAQEPASSGDQHQD